MKKCSFCAEDIQDEAVKCRFCGEFLDQTYSKNSPWYFRKTSLIVSFLVVGPFMLPLVWANPKFDTTKKLIITAAVLIATWVLFSLMAQTLKTFQDSLKMLGTF